MRLRSASPWYASVAAAVKFDSPRPGVRAAVALTFGVLAAVNGGRHAHHIINEGTTANDVTGVLALVAGVALVGLAAWIPFRHRGEGASGPARRWAIRVLMISGGGGNRRSTLRHAKMLVRNGYGVLVYDPRGSGNSEGTINSYGWGWEKDAAAALDFLAKRDDVEPGHVGVLGLSTGGDIAIDIAARRDDVKAVVVDGVAQIGYEDTKEYTDDPFLRAPNYVMFKTIEVIQGRSGPKASLADQIASSTAPHLIVSAGKPEKEWGELYDKAGGAHTTLWHLPNASHTAALRQYPAAYTQHVVSFLDTNLRPE